MEKVFKIKSRIDEFELILNIPEEWNEEKIVIACHGFDSSKDTEPTLMLSKDLEKVGIAFARFTLPYHAERRIDANDFSVENCLQDLKIVEDKIKSMYPKAKIGIYATSFGAYLALIRIKRREHNFFSIVLRSPAINMHEIFKNCLIEDEFSVFKNNGYTIRHRKTPMKVKYDFYLELENNKIFDLGEYKEKMLIYHGMIDDTAPCEDVERFAANNKNVKLVLLKNESHRISMEKIKRINVEIAKYMKNM